MTIVAAVDGGGTRTVCLLVDERGTILGCGQGGPSNISFVSRSDAEAAITAAVTAAITVACRTARGPVPVAAAAFGGPVVRDLMESVVLQLLAPAVHQRVTEAESCLASIGAEFGAVVLSGTGCFEYARNRQGRVHRTDGWGALLGDEGSAYDIARRALVAVARAFDGRGPETALLPAALAHFGGDSLRAVTRRIHADNLPRHELARFARCVTTLAATDAVARGVLRAAAERLAEGVVACIDAVGLRDETFALALCGGAFRAGAWLIDPLVQRVCERAPGARAVRPDWEPVYGTLRLAFRGAAMGWSEAAEAAFARSVGRLQIGELLATSQIARG